MSCPALMAADSRDNNNQARRSAHKQHADSQTAGAGADFSPDCRRAVHRQCARTAGEEDYEGSFRLRELPVGNQDYYGLYEYMCPYVYVYVYVYVWYLVSSERETLRERERQKEIGGPLKHVSFVRVFDHLSDHFTQIGGVGGLCTGSLLSGKWVLTAAHCILNKDSTGFANVQGTSIQVGCSDSTSSTCRTIKVKNWYPHPCYVASSMNNHDDVVMFELEEDANLPPKDYAVVDNLHGLADERPGDTVTLIGWGSVSNDPNVPPPEQLKKVDVPLATRAECDAANPGNNQIVDLNNVFCTGGLNDGKDSCTGDSGGPVVKMKDGRPWIIGTSVAGSELPSESADCGINGRYGVYAEVAKYTDFIATVMAGNTYTCSSCPCLAPADFWRTKYPNGPPTEARPIVDGSCSRKTGDTTGDTATPSASPGNTATPTPAPSPGNTVNTAGKSTHKPRPTGIDSAILAACKSAHSEASIHSHSP